MSNVSLIDGHIDEKPINYDRIKNMSVEEMTAFITKLAFFPCELCEREHNASCTHEECFNIHKQWLESEVDTE